MRFHLRVWLGRIALRSGFEFARPWCAQQLTALAFAADRNAAWHEAVQRRRERVILP